MALGWIFYKFQHSNSVARKMIKHHKPTKVEECRTSERSWTNDAHIFKNKKKLLKFKYNFYLLWLRSLICAFFLWLFSWAWEMCEHLRFHICSEHVSKRSVYYDVSIKKIFNLRCDLFQLDFTQLLITWTEYLAVFINCVIF